MYVCMYFEHERLEYISEGDTLQLLRKCLSYHYYVKEEIVNIYEESMHCKGRQELRGFSGKQLWSDPSPLSQYRRLTGGTQNYTTDEYRQEM